MKEGKGIYHFSRHLFSKGMGIFILPVLILVLTLSGCGTLDTLIQKDGNSGTIGNWIGNQSGSQQDTSAITTTGIGDGRTVALYFADSTGGNLVKEQRTIPKTLSLARETINQWIKGPATNSTSEQPVVSPKTTLLDIGINNGVATVDLSKDFLQLYGNISQEITLYGLVDTVLQFPTIKEVHLRVEGKDLNKLGIYDATHLVYKASLVKGSVSDSSSGSAQDQNSVPAGNNSNTDSNVNSSSDSNASSNTNANGVQQGNDQSNNAPLSNSPSSINLFAFPPASL